MTTVASRHAECERILAKHPNAVPVVLQRSGTSKTSVLALAPTATVADIAEAAREMSGTPRTKPVALTVAGCTPATTTSVADLHAACSSEDGFLHVSFTVEQAMGVAVAGPCFAVAGGGGSSNDFLDNAFGGVAPQ